VGVPLKDAWVRIEPHVRELRRMGAHDGERSKDTDSRNGLQSRDAETLNCMQ